MSKQSRWVQEGYLLGFEEDFIYIDISLLITKTGVEKGKESFSVQIEKCAISSGERFDHWLVSLMTKEQLDKVYGKIYDLLLVEIQPELFTYFYNGTIIDPSA